MHRAFSLLGASVLLLALLGAPPVGASELPTLVMTADGPVQGKVTAGIRQFLGIPYATPPTGDLRWRPPEPHAPWTGVRDATTFGHRCPQSADLAAPGGPVEDCLFLNVYTPTEAAVPRPVMVWIHGGSLVNGRGSDYDPSELVDRGDEVVVTINYRLGALGFLAQAALDGEGHRFANYGIMDQQLALQWVQRNIAAFGGDAANVTVFGESAGGQSITTHLLSPLSAGLFKGAIIQSGAYANVVPTLATAEAQGAAYAGAVGCSSQTADCLRSVPASTIVLREATLYITPTDGQVLLESPITGFAAGRFNRVPVLQGSNHDEYRLFVASQFDLRGTPLTAAGYPIALAAFPSIGSAARAAQVMADYPLASYPSADLAFATAIGDTLFSCSARRSNQLLSQYVPTFAYEFNDENAPSYLPPVSFPYGATHSFELSYLFGLSFLPAPGFTADQAKLARTMKEYWAAFARNGDPWVAGKQSWRPYNTGKDSVISLEPPLPQVEFDFAAQHHCAFWRALSPSVD